MLEVGKRKLTLSLINLALILNLAYLVVIIFTYGIGSSETLKVAILLLALIVTRLILPLITLPFLPTLVLSVVSVGIYWNFLFGGNGLRAPAFTAGVAFIIVYAGLLSGTKGALTMLGIHAVVASAVHFLEQRGIFFTDPKIPATGITVTGQILFFSATTYLLISTLKDLKNSLALHKSEAEYRSKAERKIRRLNQDLMHSYEITLKGWARALELKDKETEGHAHRVVELSRRLGMAYGLPRSLLSQLEYGALLHDIGKMGIPDAILHKTGPLSPTEQEMMQCHPQMGYSILKDVDYLQDALVIPQYHHERWDGSGYPDGLKGEEIPLLARIFALVDVWDALRSKRCYSEAWTKDKALQFFKDNRGVLFDPELTDLFLTLV